MIRLIDRLIQKSDFPKAILFENELAKVGLLRIFLGIVVFVRFAEISYSILILDQSTVLIFISFYILVLTAFFILGFCTPLVSLLLLFSTYACDIQFGTATLGTSILQITLIPFVLVNSGQYYSIDHLVLKRNFIITKPIKFMFKLLGSMNEKAITRAYFFTFFIYSIISFSALGLHIQDDFWINGLTTKALLLNSYLCKHYKLFRIIEENIPHLLSSVSVLASVLQSFFQFFMFPLIFSTSGRKFVYVYGLIFFLISLFFLNLSYLPHVEIILWLVIFLPIKKSKEKIEIFYDDYCYRCKKAIKILKLINFNERFIFSPTSTNVNRIARLSLSESEIKSKMAGSFKKEVLVGYNLYLKICLVNPLLYSFIPILYLGNITSVGPKVYNFIADWQYKYSGVCEFSYQDEISKKSTIAQLPIYRLPNNLLLIYFIALIPMYILFKLPLVNSLEKHIPLTLNSKEYIKKVLIHSGFDLPNVFNKTDLSMGNCWMELYRLEKGHLILVPIVGQDGERLNYNNFDILNFTNHNSDLLYFGITLDFRRNSIYDKANENMEENNFGWNSLYKRIKYDYKINKFDIEKRYLVRIFSNHQSEISIQKVDPKKFKKSLEYENWYLFKDGSIVSI